MKNWLGVGAVVTGYALPSVAAAADSREYVDGPQGAYVESHESDWDVRIGGVTAPSCVFRPSADPRCAMQLLPELRLSRQLSDNLSLFIAARWALLSVVQGDDGQLDAEGAISRLQDSDWSAAVKNGNFVGVGLAFPVNEKVSLSLAGGYGSLDIGAEKPLTGFMATASLDITIALGR